MKNRHWILVAAVAATACAAARADVFPKETLIKVERKDVAGGHGSVFTEYAFTRDKALKDQAIKELWEQAAQLATLISAKALGRSLTQEDHHRLLDEAMAEMRRETRN